VANEPAPDFLKAIRVPQGTKLLGGSACEEVGGGVREIGTGRLAFFLDSEIPTLSGETAQIEVEYHCGFVCAARYRLSLAVRNRQWVVVRERMLGQS
jgi:hypothetical protein